MKKLISILIAVVLLVTTVFGVSMFSVSATEGYSTAVIPGNPALASNNTSAKISVVDNNRDTNSYLPLDKLFKIATGGTGYLYTDFDDIASGDGLVFYIENNCAEAWFPGFYFLSGNSNYTIASTGSAWYRLGEEDDSWIENPISSGGYGAPVPAGFKGYVYIPMNQKHLSAQTNGAPKDVAITGETWKYLTFWNSTGASYGSNPTADCYISAPIVVNNLINGYPSTVGVTVGETDYTWFAPKSDEPLVDNVKLNNWVDERGQRVQLFASSTSNIPSNIATSNLTLTENTTKLPLTSLFKYEGTADTALHDITIETDGTVTGLTAKGAIIYVEIPQFETISYTPEGESAPYTTNTFRLVVDFYGHAEGVETETRYWRFQSATWSIRGVNDTSWTSKSTVEAGIDLEAGWKGYVCVPFDSLYANGSSAQGTVAEDTVISKLNIRSLTSSNEVFYTGGTGDNAKRNGRTIYGHVPAGEAFVISEPIWMLGNASDGCADFVGVNSDSLIIGQTEYDYNTGKEVDANYFETVDQNLGFAKTATYTTPLDSNGTFGIVSSYSSTAIFTEKHGKFIDYARTAGSYNSTTGLVNPTDNITVPQIAFENNVVWSTIDNKTSGFLFHITTSQGVEGERITVKPRLTGTNPTTNAAVEISFASNKADMISPYVLLDGTSSWVQLDKDTEIFNYNSFYLGTDNSAWSGYIYIPCISFNDYSSTNFVAETTLDKLYLAVNLGGYTNGAATNINKPTDNAGLTVTSSAGAVVTDFNSASTIMYADDGKVVDLATNEVVDVDYYSAKEFIGDETILVDDSDENILNLNTVRMPDTPIVGSGYVNNVKSVYSGLSDNANTKYAESVCAITKIPSAHFEGTLETYRNTVAFSYNFADIALDTIDGFMLYVKVSDNKPLWFNTYYTCDGTSPLTGYAGSFRILKKGDTEWTNTTVSISSDQTGEEHKWGVGMLPAGFEGYVYLPKLATMLTGNTENNTVCKNVCFFLVANSAADKSIKVDFGPIMTVAVGSWTETNTGIAYVNGSAVAQNMFTGDFTVANDMDADMNIDLVDLVRAKDPANMSTANFEKFRKAYLDNYFKYAESIALSAAFSLEPLVYSNVETDTANEELSVNSDRGYRSEMIVYFAKEPLVLSEATDIGGEIGVNVIASAGNYKNGGEVSVSSAIVETYYEANKNNKWTDATDYPTEESKKLAAANELITNAVRSYEYVDEDGQTYGIGGGMLITGVALGADKYTSTVKHDQRTVFASDDETTQRQLFESRFDAYKIGQNIEVTYNSKVTEGEEPETATTVITNNLFLFNPRLTDFNECEELPQSVLDMFDLFFTMCKEKNVKCMYRPCYNDNYAINNTSEENRKKLAWECASEEIMIEHIKQNAALISEHKDVIYKISNGWMGYVGEMEDDFQYPNVKYENVITAILEEHCLPNGLYYSSRLSSYIDDIIKTSTNPKWTDPESEVYYPDYIGYNNDAMYGEQTNTDWLSGGYQLGNANGMWERDTAAAATRPMDGEMFINSSLINGNKIPNGYQIILECAHHRMNDMSSWHGFLDERNNTQRPTVMALWMDESSDYYSPVTPEILENMGIAYDPAWFKEGEERNAYEFIRDHLGYRLVVTDASVTYDSKKDKRMLVSVNLKNYGFAAAFNMESSLAILDEEGNVVQELETGSPETWYNLPVDYYTVDRSESAQDDVITHTLTQRFEPVEAGKTYRLALRLKNSGGTTARLANDIEYVNGYNIIGSFSATAE